MRTTRRHDPPHKGWSFTVESAPAQRFYDFEEGRVWVRAAAAIPAMRTVHALTDPPG